MKKTFTFKKSNNNTFLFPEYTTTFKSPKKNYSEILDDIIAADVIEDNKYLFKNYNIGTDPIYISSSLKGDDDFIKATKFLANYKKNKSKKSMIATQKEVDEMEALNKAWEEKRKGRTYVGGTFSLNEFVAGKI